MATGWNPTGGAAAGRACVQIATLWLALLAVACGSQQPSTGSRSSWRLSYRLTGGSAGFDVRFTVDSSGQAFYRRTAPEPHDRVFRFGPDTLEAIRQHVESSGFLALQGRIPADHEVVDAHSYEIVWSGPAGDQTVVASDGAIMPPALLSVRELIGSLQRKVLADGVALGAPGSPDARGE